MKILFITISSPFGLKESYIANEISAIANQCEAFVSPLAPSGKITDSMGNAKVLANTRNDQRQFYKYLLQKSFRLGLILFSTVLQQKPKRALYSLYFLPRIARLCFLVDKYKIDHIHAYWATTPATAALIAAETNKIKWSFTGHRADIENNDILTTKIISACFARTISQRGAKLLEKKTGVYEKILVIHLGVDIPQNRPAGCLKSKINAVCVSDYVKIKNVSSLIDQVSQVKTPMLLDIYGEGPLKKALERQIRSLGMERKIFLKGRIDNQKLIDKYRNRRYNLLLHASTVEGIPVCVMEAMAHKIPVATTSVGAMSELVNTKNAFILKSDLSNLEDVVARDKLADESKLDSAYKKVRREFDLNLNSKKLLHKIEKCQKNQK